MGEESIARLEADDPRARRVCGTCARYIYCVCSFGQAQPDQGRKTDRDRCGLRPADASSDEDAEDEVSRDDAHHVAHQALLSCDVLRKLVLSAWSACFCFCYDSLGALCCGIGCFGYTQRW